MRIVTALFFIGMLLQGCTSRLTLHQDAVSYYQRGDLTTAETLLTESIQKNSNKDAVCLLLDRATSRFTDGDANGAIADYNSAIEAIDYYTQHSTADITAQILFQDDAAPYAGEDFEQLLARIYFALALMHEEDYNNAGAILRQAEEWQQMKNEVYTHTKLCQELKIPDNPFAKYLFALLLEKNGDLSNASILYSQASRLNSNFNPPPKNDSENATVLIVCHNGNAPKKYSATSDTSIVSLAALEILLAGSNIPPAYSSLVGIPIPALWLPSQAYPIPMTVSLDEKTTPLHEAFDIANAAQQELTQKLPLIAARGAARILMRRATVGYCQQQDPLLGAFADMGMLVANAVSQADTRSWGTLPCRIDIGRFDVPAGPKTLKLIMPQNNIFEAKLNLKPCSLCVINVFQIHPGITYILIPDKLRR